MAETRTDGTYFEVEIIKDGERHEYLFWNRPLVQDERISGVQAFWEFGEWRKGRGLTLRERDAVALERGGSLNVRVRGDCIIEISELEVAVVTEKDEDAVEVGDDD